MKELAEKDISTTVINNLNVLKDLTQHEHEEMEDQKQKFHWICLTGWIPQEKRSENLKAYLQTLSKMKQSENRKYSE